MPSFTPENRPPTSVGLPQKHTFGVSSLALLILLSGFVSIQASLAQAGDPEKLSQFQKLLKTRVENWLFQDGPTAKPYQLENTKRFQRYLEGLERGENTLWGSCDYTLSKEVPFFETKDLLIVTHAAVNFDRMAASKAGADEAIEEFMQDPDKKVIFLVEGDSEQKQMHWFTEERGPDAVLVSSGGEHEMDTRDCENVTVAGGYFSACLKSTVIDVAKQNTGTGSLRIHFPADAIFMSIYKTLADDPHFNDPLEREAFFTVFSHGLVTLQRQYNLHFYFNNQYVETPTPVDPQKRNLELRFWSSVRVMNNFKQ